MLSERLQTTMDIKNFVQCYLILLEVLEVTNNNAQEKSWQQCYYSWDNIAQVRILCNVVQTTPDNIALGKSCATLT